MNQFSELPLCPQLQDNLATLGYAQPTPVQQHAIPPAMAGHDVVATAQTGTGKTLAFLLPLLERLKPLAGEKGIQAVILSPTREIALQIEESFARLAKGTGITSAVVVGGLNEQRQLLAVRKGARVVIATPGRLCDFLQRKLVKLGSVRYFVLDEADRMLDMGFLPSIDQILRTMPEQKQTLFFSATIEPAVAHLIDKYLHEPVRVSIGPATRTAERVDLQVYEVEQDLKLSLLRRLISAEPGPVLVFARTKHGTDRLAKKLGTLGIKAAAIHGDRTQSQRNRALDGFRRGEYPVLVATDVAARGIHVDNVAHVVNFDLPQQPEDFIHRVGRTGRAGASGVASTFAMRNERNEIRRIERTIKADLRKIALPDGLTREERNVVVMPRRNAAHNAAAPSRGFRFKKRRRA